MSMPGRFRVVETDGETITIENDAGVRKRVFERTVRAAPQP